MTENSGSPVRFGLPALAAILALALGIYWFQADWRKATPSAPATPSTISRKLSTGAMSAFLVMPDRRPVGEFSFQDKKGVNLGLPAWRGRVVLVNLWATWCAPCRREMTALDRLQKKL
ncbi:MAG: TlpA family protein disulfide reductase, partial [Alphaproteobacteria bacterium]|nr:TlpA family protein disulfide reductase [Alphaproteobacteria bacterium]